MLETPKRWEYAVLVGLMVMMIALSLDYGVTFDEGGQQIYGEKVFRFFDSGFKDRSAFNYSNLYLYGGLFDGIAVLFQKNLPNCSKWDVRHMVNALFAWVGYLYIWRLGRLLSGRLMGWLALGLLLLSPMYFSHMANNPKDMPFASAYIMALYYIICIWRELPRLRLLSVVKVILAIGFAINMRVGGLLLICYLEMVLGLWVLQDSVKRGRLDRQVLRRPLLVAVFAPPLMVVAGTVGWPWAQWQPLTRPFEALGKMSQFEWQGNLNFNGTMVHAARLPWTYAPLWFGVTTPLIVLVGLILGLIWLVPSRRRWELLLLCFAGVFPVIYVIYKHSILYNGVRHLLFVYPPLVALAAYGLASTYRAVAGKSKQLKVALVAIFAVLACEPLAYAWRNHPNEGVYFNFFVGGTRGAYKKYDLDYWGNCAKQALLWLADLSEREQRTLRVGPYRPEDYQVMQLGRNDRLDFPGNNQNLDYQVVEFTGLVGDPQRREEVEHSSDVVYRVEADGAPLCYVLKANPSGR